MYFIPAIVIADSDDLAAHAATADIEASSALYISANSYIQNPYINMPSLTGTRYTSESVIQLQNVAQKWFTDGTWNVIGEASYINQNGANNYGYGANIFAQTGYVAGFSFGGFLTIMNPVLSSNINPSNPSSQAQSLPIDQQIGLQELFVEYQKDNIVQVDAGYIGINNSPWLTYYLNTFLNLVTYRGSSVNIHPGGGWLLTGVVFDDTQLLGEDGFSQQTLYNQSVYNFGPSTSNTGNNGSPSTIALGANWSTPLDNLGVRLWDYQFTDYANLAYIDSTLKFPVTSDLSFNLAAQGGIEGGNGNDVFANAGYGTVSSNIIGMQGGINYDIFLLQFGYNNVWGSSTAYGGGDIVSPYTYQYATDPLYTTAWIFGLVEKSAGSAYKITPALNLLDNKLQLSTSYAYYATTAQPPSSEYDLQINYLIPQIKGLTVYGGFGYLLQSVEQGGNFYMGQVMLSYLY